MSGYLDAKPAKVRDLLDGRRRFAIPRFQRPYAWTTEEAGALLSDIDAARERARSEPDAPSGWFIGSVVLARAAGGAPERVVDGHQRLTTLTILFAVLRDLDPKAQRVARAVAGPGGGFFRRAETPNLPLRELDAAFFAAQVQAAGATARLTPEIDTENDAQANIVSVALAFRERLSELADAERAALAEFALDECHLIEVAAADEEEAYRLFSVLNTRGKDLRPGDVLKSELLGAAPAAERARLADVWEGTEAALGEAHFGAHFSHLRMIATRRKRERAVFAELRDAMDPLSDPVGFIEEAIGRKGRVFREISGAALRIGPRSAEANRLLRALRRVRNRDWEPTALAYLAGLADLHDLDGDAAAGVVRVLKAIERRAYAMLLMSGDENMRIARYRPALAAIAEGADAEGVARALELSDTERRVAREVLDGPIGSKERARLPTLLRVDEHLSDGAIDYAGVDATVEHVLPRNPEFGSAWLALWPNEAERKKWLHRLGNLALLSRRRNNSAANYAFERKKREYIGRGGVTPFAITAQVLNEATWTPEVVKARHQKLLDAAFALWDL